MCRIQPFLLVVLLLTVDWVFDPHHGASSFSSPCSSQPCLHVKLGRHHSHARLDRDLFSPALLALNSLASVSQTAWLRLPLESAACFEADLIYLFMTIQR